MSKIDWIKPVMPRDWPDVESVEVLRTNLKTDKLCVLSLWTHKDGAQTVCTHMLTGQYDENDRSNPADLINIPEPPEVRKGWIVAWHGNQRVVVDCLCHTLAAAQTAAAMYPDGNPTIIEITYEVAK